MADVKYSGWRQQIESKYPANLRCILARQHLHYPASLPVALRQIYLEQAVSLFKSPERMQLYHMILLGTIYLITNSNKFRIIIMPQFRLLKCNVLFEKKYLSLLHQSQVYSMSTTSCRQIPCSAPEQTPFGR